MFLWRWCWWRLISQLLFTPAVKGYWTKMIVVLCLSRSNFKKKKKLSAGVKEGGRLWFQGDWSCFCQKLSTRFWKGWEIHCKGNADVVSREMLLKAWQWNKADAIVTICYSAENILSHNKIKGRLKHSGNGWRSSFLFFFFCLAVACWWKTGQMSSITLSLTTCYTLYSGNSSN